MLSEVKVSTVIAAYNAERTISDTVESALAQTCADHEIVVVNDGSTDSTASVLAQFGSSIRILNQENLGSGAARNNGVAHAKGAYIAFLDSDDLWVPEKLATSVSSLERNARASLAFSEYGNFDKSGAECGGSSIGHAPSMEELMDICVPPILTSTWVVRREMFKRSGGFYSVFKGPGFEDSWTLLLLRELGEFVYIPDRLTLYRIGEGAESADKYALGLKSFVALARARYGRRRARALVRNAKNLQCRWLLTKIAHQMDRGDRKGAIRSLLRIAKLQPAYFFSSEFIKRLFLSHNMKRARDLTATFPARS